MEWRKEVEAERLRLERLERVQQIVQGQRADDRQTVEKPGRDLFHLVWRR